MTNRIVPKPGDYVSTMFVGEDAAIIIRASAVFRNPDNEITMVVDAVGICYHWNNVKSHRVLKFEEVAVMRDAEKEAESH